MVNEDFGSDLFALKLSNVNVLVLVDFYEAEYV